MVATATRPNQIVKDGEEFEQLTPRRRRRRPGWILAGIGLVVLSMLVGVLLFTWTATTRKVLALDQAVSAGQQIAPEDLRVVDVNPDKSFGWIAVSDQDEVVGKAVLGAMPEGTILAKGMLTNPALVLDEGKVEIPYAADDSVLPFSLAEGNTVNLFSTTGESDDGSPPESRFLGQARVVSVAQSPSTTSNLVTLLADQEQQGEIIQAIADNDLQLALAGR